MAEVTLEIKDSYLGCKDEKQKKEGDLLEILLETLKQLEVNDNGNVV